MTDAEPAGSRRIGVTIGVVILTDWHFEASKIAEVTGVRVESGCVLIRSIQLEVTESSSARGSSCSRDS